MERQTGEELWDWSHSAEEREGFNFGRRELWRNGSHRLARKHRRRETWRYERGEKHKRREYSIMSSLINYGLIMAIKLNIYI